MTEYPNRKFADLLWEGVHCVAVHQNRKMGAIKDEIGQMLDYPGGSIVEYWRRGHVPESQKVIQIARYCIENSNLDVKWARQFLDYGRVPERDRYLAELFPQVSFASPSTASEGNSQDQEGNHDTNGEPGEQILPKVNAQNLPWVFVSALLVLFVVAFSVYFRSLPPDSDRFGQSIPSVSAPGQIPVTGGPATNPFHPPPDAVPFIINAVTFDPLPPAKTDRIKIFACTQGRGGVGITLKVSVNTAADGSDKGGWIRLGELGVPCFNQDNAPVWDANGWKQGIYLIEIVAKTSDDPNWEHAQRITVVYALQ